MTSNGTAEPSGSVSEPLDKNGKDKAAHCVEMLVAGYPQAFIEFFETTNGISKKGGDKLGVGVGRFPQLRSAVHGVAATFIGDTYRLAATSPHPRVP